MLPVIRDGREFQDINAVLQNLDFQSNFNCSIINLTDIAAGEFNFPHGLKVAPSGRIIIKQIGGGFITDSNTPPDSKNMYLINNGATNIDSLTIIVLR